MSSAVLTPSLSRRSLPALYWKEIRYEFLKLARARVFSLSAIGFPVMFYVLFGLSNRGNTIESMDAAKYMLAGYYAFGLIGAALFSIGAGLATERAQGWLELKRASPMPPFALLFARCVTAQAFGLIIVCILSLLAVCFGGVHLSASELLKAASITLAGTIPFAAMGLLIALVSPPNAAAGVVNLLYLPMSFLSGLWIPLKFLPHFLRPISPYLPAFHLSQLMLSAFGYANPSYSLESHWLGLAGFTLLMLGLSWAVFHRAEQDA